MKQKVAALTISAAALVGMAVHEGYRDRAYYATADEKARGISTIGFGETQGVTPRDTTTVEKALVRLLARSQGFEAELKECFNSEVSMSQGQWDSVVSLAYNVGVPAVCKSTLARKANAGEEWCAEILRWNRQNGVILPGLTKRRQEEYAKCVT